MSLIAAALPLAIFDGRLAFRQGSRRRESSMPPGSGRE